jgi:hypothetical protein
LLTAVQSTADATTYTSSAVSLGAESRSRKIIIGIASYRISSQTAIPSGVTADFGSGAVSATLLTSLEAFIAGGFLGSVSWWIVNAPTSATADIVTTFANSQSGRAAAYYRAVSYESTATETKTTSGVDPAVSVTPPADSIVVGGTCTGSGFASTTWTNLTEDADSAISGELQFSWASATHTTSPGTQTITADSFLSAQGPLAVVVLERGK